MPYENLTPEQQKQFHQAVVDKHREAQRMIDLKSSPYADETAIDERIVEIMATAINADNFAS